MLQNAFSQFAQPTSSESGLENLTTNTTHCIRCINLENVSAFTLALSFIIDHKQKTGAALGRGDTHLQTNNCLVFSKLIFV